MHWIVTCCGHRKGTDLALTFAVWGPFPGSNAARRRQMAVAAAYESLGVSLT